MRLSFVQLTPSHKLHIFRSYFAGIFLFDQSMFSLFLSLSYWNLYSPQPPLMSIQGVVHFQSARFHVFSHTIVPRVLLSSSPPFLGYIPASAIVHPPTLIAWPNRFNPLFSIGATMGLFRVHASSDLLIWNSVQSDIPVHCMLSWDLYKRQPLVGP